MSAQEVGFDLLQCVQPTNDLFPFPLQTGSLHAAHGCWGATAAAELEAEGTRDPEWAISQAKRFVDAGAYMIMIESEGITENVKTWRTVLSD